MQSQSNHSMSPLMKVVLAAGVAPLLLLVGFLASMPPLPAVTTQSAIDVPLRLAPPFINEPGRPASGPQAVTVDRDGHYQGNAPHIAVTVTVCQSGTIQEDYAFLLHEVRLIVESGGDGHLASTWAADYPHGSFFGITLDQTSDPLLAHNVGQAALQVVTDHQLCDTPVPYGRAGGYPY